MAELSNFIDKKRNIVKVISFVMREGFRVSKKVFILRSFAAILSTALTFVEIGALSIVINEFTTRGITDARPLVLGLGIGGIILFQFLPKFFTFIEHYYWEISWDTMLIASAKNIHDGIELLDIATIDQPEFKNKLYLANTRGIQSMAATQNWIIEIIRYVASLVIASVALAIISPLSLLIIVLGTLPIFIIERVTGKHRYQAWEEQAEHRRIISAKQSAVNNTHQILENKLNFSLSYFINKIFSLTTSAHQKLWSLNKKSLKLNLWGEIISGTSIGFAIWFILRGILQGASSIGSLVFSVATIGRFQNAIVMIMRSLGRIGEHSKNINQILDIIEMESYIPSDVQGKKVVSPITIEFKNVSFMYPGKEHKVINNINLIFEEGKNTALVGLNGAGKTTLMKLLTRAYDPTEGEILVNGINLKEYSLDSWRNYLGILLQDFFIYSEETIRENIMLGNLTLRNEDSVYQAAKLATADTFIKELPGQYDQKIGNDFKGGVELSKGQKQKLVLARTWYRRAPFLILDEPTAAIDAVSEDTIFKNLFERPESFG